MSFSIIQYYGKQESRCGYCKGTNCSVSHSMHAFQLKPQDYQDLIDRGWRRSGHYCYKPEMATTCCPCYTIKCDALEFKLSKSHKKILKRFNRFLRDGKKDANDVEMQNAENVNRGHDKIGGLDTEPQVPSVEIPNVNIDEVCSANDARILRDAAAEKIKENVKVSKKDKTSQEPIDLAVTECAGDNDTVGSSKADTVKLPCKKAKQIRLERRAAKLAAKGITEETIAEKSPKNKEKTLQDFLNETTPNDKHKLKIVLVHSNKLNITDEAYNLYRKYQISIHNDNPDRLTTSSLERFLYKSPLKVNSKEFENSLTATYKLYEKYQKIIHDDPPSHLKEYLEFLQRSPLKLIKTTDGPPAGYGSFHQQYWLDDTLIAVAVIDILPYCISSVYFFYDPDYNFLTLGTYGSLREIAFVQELAEKVPALRYYYMGFYVHSCPKMRYKGRLVPSYLLCPETYTWHFLTQDILSKLDANKYQRLSLADTKDVEEFKEEHLDDVLLLVEPNRIIRYREYIQSFNIKRLDHMLDSIKSRIYKEITGDADDRECVLEYGKMVGKSCSQRLIYLKMD